MEVRYTLTPGDYVACCMYEVRNSGTGRRQYLFSWCIWPILCVGCVGVLCWAENPYAQLVAFALAAWAACVTVVFPFRYWPARERNVRAYLRKKGTRGITGLITLILSEESLVLITETIRSEVKWEMMQGVVEVGNRTYIFITGVSAAVLPRHGFDTDEEYEAVRDFALRKLADRVRN